MEIHISVRNLIEFILRSGDIDNRRSAAPDNIMQEGSRIHRMIQRQMGLDYHAEVPLKYQYDAGEYQVIITGRADGIIIPDSIGAAGEVTVDEIKATYRDISKMKEPAAIHLDQAKCYAFIYADQEQLENIRIRMTYCNIETEEFNYFYHEFSYQELHDWFENLMRQYRKWADYEYQWRAKRLQSIKELVFPFPYRDGQRELVTYVYQTIFHKRKLYIEAPTGVGKTISTVFPAVKAMGEGMGEKLFYLTAKTITRTVAEETFALLRGQRLSFKTVILTAKDKICFREETECNPVACPYANGHYDRVNDAIFALLTEADSFTREKIEEYARQFQVCPFELCLDMSLFADGVICDYNYLFDPHVYLKRFFTDGSRKEYLFLIDEAHNLVDRGREMYSAVLRKEDFLKLKKIVKEYDANIARRLDQCNRELLLLKRECEGYRTDLYLEPFLQSLSRLTAALDRYLEEHETSPVRNDIRELYFEVCHFQVMNERLDENYVTYSQVEEDGSFFVKLFCVNPAKSLRECMMKGRSSVLFSATLLPIHYYKRLLGADEGDYDVYAKSVFRPDKKGLFIAGDVTSKYTRRNDAEYYNIARYLHEIIKNRHGKYMVFFPSYQFLRKVYAIYQQNFREEPEVECLLQGDHMNEKEREAFLRRFMGTQESAVISISEVEQEAAFAGNEAEARPCEDASGNIQNNELPSGVRGRGDGSESTHSLLGFCVLGGIFSEGIDLKNDSLIGAIIVGTGLPQVCPEREILKGYFDGRGESGFDYAYKLPGINKVLQAAGRVIRTQDDIGVIALLDERFLSPTYLHLFPREWDNYETVTVGQIAGRIEKFWNDWL